MGLLSGLALMAAAAVASPPFASAALPDGRAYEWVTPTLDGAAIQTSAGALAGTTASGDRLVFTTNDAPSGAASSGVGNVIEAARSATGWTDSSLEPASLQAESGFLGTGVAAVSPDLSEAVVATDEPLATGASTGENLYMRNADGSYTLITDAAQGAPTLPGSTGMGLPTVAGTSADFSHIFFNPTVPQLPNDLVSTDPGNLYQWAGGQLSLVNILPDGMPGNYPAVLADSGVGLPGASSDGSDVLFQDNLGAGTGPLYLRSDNTSTIEVDTSQRSPADPETNGTVYPSAVGITANGSEAFFTSHAELTQESDTGSSDGILNDSGNDLYVYDVDTAELTDLTVDNNPDDSATGADVQAVLGASPDGSYIYFTAFGDLAAGATSGALNLYVEHDDAVSFIASGTGIAPGGADAFYVTPDGENAAFVSSGDLTGYDATDADTGGADTEVYEYDAPADTLTCASCRPDGSQPTGSATLPVAAPGWSEKLVSDDGRRVFFDSSDALPGASNGLQNVYEWEADGDGSCIDAGGCVFLLSSGTGGSPADLLAASPTGEDVFFVSYDPLVPQDQTGQAALVDARVGGGFAALTPAPVPCSSSDSCQGSPSAPLPVPSIGSVSFIGTGSPRSGHIPGVSISSRAVDGDRFALTIKVPAAGMLIVGGTNLRPVRRVLHRREKLNVVITLNAAGARLLAKRHILRVSVTASYLPRSGTQSSTRIMVTVATADVISKAIRGRELILHVHVPSAGVLTVSGAGLRSASLRVGRVSTYRLALALAPTARQDLARGRRAAIVAHVVFRPAVGAASVDFVPVNV